MLHRRTEGQPLFMVQAVEAWVQQGWLREVAGHWVLQVGLETLETGVPESVRQMLVQQFEGLSPAARAMPAGPDGPEMGGGSPDPGDRAGLSTLGRVRDLLAGLGAGPIQGQKKAGLGQLQQGLTAVLATGQRLGQPLCLVLLAEVAGHAGHLEEGLRQLAEAYRLQEELLLRQAISDVAQAEACFHEALAISRRQPAPSWALRAAMSLGRLWQRQGKRQTAHQLLAEVYGGCTEGFGTADLQEAKALLEELGT